MRARRSILIAALALMTTVLAGPAPAIDFVSVAKRAISGKTGEPADSVEVHADGQVVLKDALGDEVVAATLPPEQLAAVQALVGDPALIATPVCEEPLGADLDQFEIVVRHEWRTLSLLIAAHCHPPPATGRLSTMLDELRAKYLPDR